MSNESRDDTVELTKEGLAKILFRLEVLEALVIGIYDRNDVDAVAHLLRDAQYREGIYRRQISFSLIDDIIREL